MKVLSAQFLKSVMKLEQCPKDGKPEFAFVGRSNVGKSSLLNRLLDRKGLAKTSSTPGKTQTINFFAINQSFYFVDLPGYGYAKVPKPVKEQWASVMTHYLRNRDRLRLVLQLIDARHPPTANDHEMLDLLEEAEVPTLIVATKADKLTKSDRSRCAASIRKELGLDEDSLVIPFSAVTGDGVREIWRVVEDLLRS